MPIPTTSPTDAIRATRDRVGPSATLAITGAVGAAVFVALLAASAAVYDAVADSDGVSGLDQPVLQAMIALRTPGNEYWVTAFTNLGDTPSMVVLTLVLTGLALWRWRRRSIAVLVVVASTGSLVFTAAGKAVVGRKRPPLAFAVPPYEYAPSFPSGHTLNSTVISLTLAYVVVWLGRRWWIRGLSVLAAVCWSVAMGLSRVFLGHHWLTDVIFGWLFGLAWLALVGTVHRILVVLERRERLRAAEPGVPPDDD